LIDLSAVYQWQSLADLVARRKEALEDFVRSRPEPTEEFVGICRNSTTLWKAAEDLPWTIEVYEAGFKYLRDNGAGREVKAQLLQSFAGNLAIHDRDTRALEALHEALALVPRETPASHSTCDCLEVACGSARSYWRSACIDKDS
jgi:hypothetical protein